MPLGDFLQIREALLGDGCSVVDVTPIVRGLRMVKSAAEIEKIAHICGLVSAGFSALPDWATPGEIEREIFSKFKIALLRRGADDVPYLVGGAGPGGYGDIISPPSDRGIQVGDVLMLDTGSVFDGYYCDFDRNYAFGTPSERVCRAHDLLYQATETGFKASRPGVTAADVFHAMRRELDQWDSSSNRTGRLGHGLGMQLTEWPSVMPTDETILRPGMVLTLEPGLEIGAGKMMVHEEDIVIRESGAELLTKRAPRELPIIQ
jgi:Xaa-Pro aminopeptidase